MGKPRSLSITVNPLPAAAGDDIYVEATVDSTEYLNLLVGDSDSLGVIALGPAVAGRIGGTARLWRSGVHTVEVRANRKGRWVSLGTATFDVR